MGSEKPREALPARTTEPNDQSHERVPASKAGNDVQPPEPPRSIESDDDRGKRIRDQVTVARLTFATAVVTLVTVIIQHLL